MRVIAGFAAVCVISQAVSASVVWDESIDGALSNDPSAPTQLNFSVGDNFVSGTTGPGSSTPPSNGYDVFSFTILAGQELLSINHTAWTPDVSTNTTGTALWDGATGDGTGTNLVGGLSMSSITLGNDILLGINGGPLGPGTYTFETREFGGQTEWTLNFVVVPAPGAASLVGVAAFCGARRRRR